MDAETQNNPFGGANSTLASLLAVRDKTFGNAKKTKAGKAVPTRVFSSSISSEMTLSPAAK